MISRVRFDPIVMTLPTVEIADRPSIEAVKTLQPLPDEGNTECQCCFGDDHLVSWALGRSLFADPNEPSCGDYTGLHDPLSRWTPVLQRLLRSLAGDGLGRSKSGEWLFINDWAVRLVLKLSICQPVHCMHESGCQAEFAERDVKKVLVPKVANSYLALVQRKELEAAGLENLETCPSCEFAIVIENDNEKLFTCQHPDCETVSCRGCKKPVSRSESFET